MPIQAIVSQILKALAIAEEHGYKEIAVTLAITGKIIASKNATLIRAQVNHNIILNSWANIFLETIEKETTKDD